MRRFVAGETLPEALGVVAELKGAGFRTTIDVLGESVSTPADAQHAADAYIATLEALARDGLDRNVSIKLTQFGLAFDPVLCRREVRRVAEAVKRLDGFVRVDMEDHLWTDATLDVVHELRRDHPNVGIVLQAYLRRTGRDLEMLIDQRVPIRLCKGAYDEPPEVAYATKAEVDASYVRLMERLLRSDSQAALATHDPAIIEHAKEFAVSNAIPSERFEFQMLYGIRRDLQRALVDEGHRMRVYVPYGREWYPYFMRRLAERPANVGFVLRSVLDERDKKRPKA